MFLPMIVVRHIDGPEVDLGVGITLGLAAVFTLGLGLFLESGCDLQCLGKDHSLFGIPVQLWALPMALSAFLLLTGIITTAEALVYRGRRYPK